MNIGNLIDAARILASFRSTSKKYSCWMPAAAALMALSQGANAQTVVPVLADSICNFNWRQVPDWFPPTAPKTFIPLNGFINPADSLEFPHRPIQAGLTNCDFYAWSAQMFLWLTSPAPASYGQGSHVFNSPVFYDVLPSDPTTGQRTFSRISPGNLRSFGVSISQRGPQGKPVVFDNTGKMFTVISPQVGPGGKTLIRNKAGQPVEIARVQVARNGKPIFLDKAGKTINVQVARNGSPLILDQTGKQINVQPTIKVINGRSFFQDGPGNLIGIEQGEADGKVLMAQTGSLVYYALEVNDVYESFLTGQKIGVTTALNFPTTQQDLTTTQNNAGTTFPDANALAVEVKSAWIETTGLAHPDQYVTITATIPAYTPPLAPPFTSGITTAVQSGTRQATLALVGMHIVGTALGHPEMIWATFEHVNNTPNAPYSYNQVSQGLTMVPQSAGGNWLFSATPTAITSDPPRMRLNGTNIQAIGSSDISPANILRINPWGSDAQYPDGTPIDLVTNNSDIIAVNNAVRTLLATGDARRNYILTGTTWIEGFSNNPPGPGDPVSQLGTYGMGNTTMETFQQGGNCFMCHDGTISMLGKLVPQTPPNTPPQPPTAQGLSHIYGPLLPLISK
jgi:hypothetical protein